MKIQYMAWVVVAITACGSSVPPIQNVAMAPPPPPVEILSVPTTPHLQAYREEGGFPEYLVGAGDVLQVTMRDVEVSQETVVVRPDGNISFSLVENVRAAGLTPTQLDERLTEELRYFLRTPRIDIEVKEYRSKMVSLLGAIRNADRTGVWTGQGRYPLKTKTTVLDLILEAGGTTPDAQLERVQLIREGASYQLDLQRVLDTGARDQNVALQGGDIVIVPGTALRSKKVIVLGEVSNPSVYMFSGDARLLEALSQAGGLTNSALRDDIRLIRVADSEPRVLVVDYNRLTGSGDLSQNVPLENDDIIYVPRSFMGDFNDVIAKIEPLLSVLLLPATYRDLYTTGGGLRWDTGEAEGPGNYILPSPGAKIPARSEDE